MFCPLCEKEIGCDLPNHLKKTHKIEPPKDLGAWYREQMEKLVDEFVKKFEYVKESK